MIQSILFVSLITMHQAVLLFFLMSCFTYLQGEKYTSKWDNINVDEILASDRLLGNYKKCLMDEEKCTPDGNELKKNLPDALKTECSRCTEKQKANTEKVINYMMDKKKEWWSELQNKYDPTGIYYKRRLQRKQIEEEESKNIKKDS